jgi:hypothetical protein
MRPYIFWGIIKWLFLLFVSQLLWGQRPQPQSLDLLFDPDLGVLRPAIGSASSGMVMGPIDPGMILQLAEMPRRRDYVLAAGGDDSRVFVLKNAGGVVTSRAIDLPAAPELIVISPAGSSAAIYYARNNLIYVVTGLPDSPLTDRTVSMAAERGSLSYAAISDDGQVVLAAVETRTSRRLFVESSGFARAAGPFRDISGIAFFGAGHDALIADRKLSAVYRIGISSSRPEVTELAGPDDGISEPVGVALSADNSRAFAVNATGDVLEVNVSGGARPIGSCPCTPSGLSGMPGNARFRLNGLPDTPLWIFDGDKAHADVFFVPVDSSAGREN